MSAAPTRSITIPLVAAERVLAQADAVVIDLRSPAEFAEDHLPGAHNVPLFDNAERAIIGTLYAKLSPSAAFDEGRVRTRARIGELVATVARIARWEPPAVDLAERVERLTADGIDGLEGALESALTDELPADAVVLSCWRGGLRSRSVVALLRELGLERAVCIDGGYREYRRRVRTELDAWQAPPAFVLRGWTGVGKTLVLREIERLRPGWTIDLEQLAGHRSSILGMVGLEPCSQKTFESRLAERLRAGTPGLCVFEGESRKVGDVIVPDTAWRALVSGTNIELFASTAQRCRVLIDDYLEDDANRVHLAQQLPFIEERLGPKRWEGKLVELLDAERDHELVEILLERYYDPLYAHSEKKHTIHTRIDSEDPLRAARDVVAWIETRA